MKWICIVVAALAGVVTASGEGEIPLDWAQCLELAGRRSFELAAARSAVRELEYEVSSQSAGFLPTISLSASFTKSGEDKDSGWDETDRSKAGISLSQDLFSGGNNSAKRKRALAQLDVGREQYRETLSDVELRLRQAFVEALYAREQVELTHKIALRRENNVRLIRLRFDGGRENAGSHERSKAQLAQAQFEVRQAERAQTYALRNLSAAMGATNIDFVAGGALAAALPVKSASLEKLVPQTPDYRIAQTQLTAAGMGLEISRSARFPKLTLDASTGLKGEQDLRDREWSIGLKASMDLMTGALRSDVAAAREKVIQSEMDLLNEYNSLIATLQQRWNSYMDAVEEERVVKQLLEAETLRAKISTAKYKQGLLSFEDWDQIESNLIDQDKRYLQRRRAAELEQARWRNALGLSAWYTEQGEYDEKSN